MRNELAEILFEEAPDAILVATKEGRYVDANPAALRLLGYSREELLRLSIRDVILPRDVERMERGRRQPLEGVSWRNEYILVRKDGSLVSTEIMSRALPDGRLVGFVRDISERVALDEALDEEKRRLSDTLEAADIASWQLDVSTGKLTSSPLLRQFFGLTDAEADVPVEEWIQQRIHPDDQSAVSAALARSAVTGEKYQALYRVVLPDGSLRWLDARGRPRLNEKGAQISLVGTVVDVTARMAAQEALRERSQFIETVNDLMPTLLYVYDIKERKNVFVNRQTTAMLGYTPEETLAMGSAVLPTLIHPEDLAGLDEHHKRVAALPEGGIETFEYRMRHRAGHYCWFNGRDMVLERDADGSPRLTIGTAEDVTTRKETEAALRHSEARYRALTEATTAIIWVTDPQGAFTQRVDSWSEFTGQTEDEYRGWGWLNAIHPEDRESVAEGWKEALESGSLYEAPYRLRHHDGSYRYTVARAAPLRDDAGEIVEWSGANEDVHDQLTAEMALRESEERFRMLADNIAQFAWMGDADGYLFWYNRRWFDYTGTTLNDMKGWGWQAVQHPDHIDRVTAKFAAHVRAKIPWEDTFPLRGADGAYRWFLSRAFPFRNAAGEVVRWFGTNTDITEQREAEQDLRRHQVEVEALNARLKRAMQETHHRVKNNLQVISALVEMQTGETAETPAALRRINQHVQALAVIHDLLTQQAKGDADLSRIGSRAVLERLVAVMRTTIGEREITAQVDDIPLTPQQASALALLVSECVSNAVKHSAGDIEITLRRDGTLARLEVCDDGTGFPTDFDPDKAANTGLQLIENAARWDLRGDVRYDTHLGGGGRVAVVFPCQQEDAFAERSQ